MTDFRNLLSTLRRPRLLIRAAHCGMADYQRDRDLRRLVNFTGAPERSVPRLVVEEERMEEIRQAGDAAYSVARHIEVLIALIAEVRLLPRAMANG
jgi:hypothetical protein